MLPPSKMNDEIDKLKSRTDRQCEQLKRIVKVLLDNGVKDDDFKYNDYSLSYSLESKLRWREEEIDKAMGICAILEAIKSPKKLSIFKRPPADELTIGLLDQLKDLYKCIAE